jgi:hypothetical protein
MKVIAWTNDTVRHFNAQIRKLIYGEHVTQKIMIGEKLVADAPITNPMVTHSILLHNNQEMVVKEFTIAQKDIVFQVTPYSIEDDGLRTESFTYYDTLVEYERFIRGQIIKMTARIHILHEDYDKLFDDMMDQSKKFILKSNKPAFKKSEMWKAYYGNLNKFARTKYNYAITAHKSQGSTYNNAMMLNWDIDKNRRVEERNRIKYVAATRPRHKLYIVT